MSQNINRRSFLKSIPAGAALAVACSPNNEVVLEMQPTGDSLYDNFQRPKSQAKPFFRWWWNDNRVTEKEVRRELRHMAANGAGGVEINPIALPDVYDNLKPEKLTWLSREWNQVLKAAVDEAQKNDMIVDLIVGTGWPFGGEFLDNDETVQGIELIVKRIEGPVSLEEKIDIPADENHDVLQVKLFPAKISSVEEGIDLFYHMNAENILRVDVPRGEWNVYIITRKRRFRDVMFGAQGGDGPVLDHFNKQAVRKYLDRMSNVLNPLFGGSMGNGIRAMFCDSIELKGANWTDDLTDEFLMRTGYDVSPWLPLLLADHVDASNEILEQLARVRYDYSTTLADLFMERFILLYHDWCLQNGVVSRYQAYGHPWLYTDLLDGYLVPDIPEGDQWLYNGGWVNHHRIDDIRYAIWNKYASSGGHLTGKRIISSEAMTNTSGIFEATLEYIKQATDLNIIGGVNHFVLHGYNYSPPEASFPGWIRFGTFFGEHNTWAPYFKLWADYAARLSQIFQDSQYVAQVAILGPTPDVWREHGLDRNPWNTTPPYLHDLWQALNHHGYCSDYLNGTILSDAELRSGKIEYGPMSYDVLIVADVKSIAAEHAQRLLNFAETGGKILFINETPSQSPGMTHREKNDLLVAETMAVLLGEFPHTVVVKKFKRGNLTNWIGKRMDELAVKPAVGISHPDERLFMLNHKYDDRAVYFFCNSDRKRSIEFNVEFNHPGKTPWMWDAETGDKFVYAAADQPLDVALKPLQSLLLVFQEKAEGQKRRVFKMNPKKFYEIQGPWTVEFRPMFGAPFEKIAFHLQDFQDVKELHDFSGSAIYTCTFRFQKSKHLIVDLGEVYDIAEVSLNGKNLGVAWWGEKQFFIDDELVDGDNRIAIKVTTTLYNYVQSLQGRPVVDYWLARRKNKGLVSAGLVGPVRLYKSLD